MPMFQYKSQAPIQEWKSGSAGHEYKGIHWT